MESLGAFLAHKVKIERGYNQANKTRRKSITELKLKPTLLSLITKSLNIVLKN